MDQITDRAKVKHGQWVVLAEPFQPHCTHPLRHLPPIKSGPGGNCGPKKGTVGLVGSGENYEDVKAWVGVFWVGWKRGHICHGARPSWAGTQSGYYVCHHQLRLPNKREESKILSFLLAH